MMYSFRCTCGVWVHGDVPEATVHRLNKIFADHHTGEGHARHRGRRAGKRKNLSRKALAKRRKQRHP